MYPQNTYRHHCCMFICITIFLQIIRIRIKVCSCRPSGIATESKQFQNQTKLHSTMSHASSDIVANQQATMYTCTEKWNSRNLINCNGNCVCSLCQLHGLQPSKSMHDRTNVGYSTLHAQSVGQSPSIRRFDVQFPRDHVIGPSEARSHLWELNT